jgi:hypothetical protein
MSAEDAYSLTNTYLDQDPLEPFGVTYEAFFQNPGIISDQQFIDQAAATDFTVDPSLIESDGEAVSAYAASCAAGAGGGSPDQIMGSGDCERMYNACAARVRMIPTARARALAWAACMAAYAACRGIQEVK